jgi:hypothetical protein
MAKKTARSRSAAQRSGSRSKQKSFELVRPASEVDVLEATEEDDELEEVDEEEEDTNEDDETGETADEEAVEVVKRPDRQRVSVPAQPTRRVVETESLTKIAAPTTSVAAVAPTSAAARLAARRQHAQQEKNQRPAANLILAENYAYVRKDLVFILILAIIMFAGILVLHFIPAIGG